jgi:hypothetical protein
VHKVWRSCSDVNRLRAHSNPTFSLSRISTPVEIDIERRIVADILSLATLPFRSDIAHDRIRQAQLRAARETLRVGADARRNYYRALAAQQAVGLLSETNSAAEAAVKLAQQLAQTGAMNKLDQTREQVFHARSWRNWPPLASAQRANASNLYARLGFQAAIRNSSSLVHFLRYRSGLARSRKPKSRPSAAGWICKSRASKWTRSPSLMD